MRGKDRQIQTLIDSIEDEVSFGANYSNYDSALGWDVDEDMLYDSALGFDPDDDSALGFANDQGPVKGLSTYAINIIYTDNSGSGLPVQVELFGTDFNTGVQVGDTLVFTNGAGDTATISGVTASFIAFQNRLRYGNFRIRYARLNPQDAAQFGQQLRYQFDSVYGGGKFNTQQPEEYFTPEQFQALRVDVPMGYKVDSERRLIFNVGATEVAPGYNITFWIDKLENAVRRLDGKPSVVNMGGQGIQNSMPTLSTRAALNKLIKATNKNVVAARRPMFLRGRR